jgi:hypothetical protein
LADGPSSACSMWGHPVKGSEFRLPKCPQTISYGRRTNNTHASYLSPSPQPASQVERQGQLPRGFLPSSGHSSSHHPPHPIHTQLHPGREHGFDAPHCCPHTRRRSSVRASCPAASCPRPAAPPATTHPTQSTIFNTISTASTAVHTCIAGQAPGPAAPQLSALVWPLLQPQDWGGGAPEGRGPGGPAGGPRAQPPRGGHRGRHQEGWPGLGFWV